MLETDVEQMKKDLKEVDKEHGMNSSSNCCICTGYCAHSGPHSACIKHGTMPKSDPAVVPVSCETQLLSQILQEMKDLNYQMRSIKDDVANLRMKYVSRG